MDNENIKILTIDDNDSIRFSIASYLEDMGYDVLEADCGEKGIDIINSNDDIDVVLTDTHMPGISGIDVLRFIREYNPYIPIIIISGAGEIKYAVDALKEGAWDYITKPIADLNILNYAIEKVVKRGQLIIENRDKTIEIEEKNRELNKTIEILKETQKQLIESEKMASLGYMVKSVAHEINTPLGVCMTSISHITSQSKKIENLNNEKRLKLSDFNNYINETYELSNITYNSLLSINRLITNFKQLSIETNIEDKKKFEVNDLVASIILLISSSFPNKKLDFKITGEVIEVESYPEVFNKIFTNLVENSIVHSLSNLDSGFVKVNLSRDADSIKIEYTNVGDKISDEIIKKIFDPFFTVNKKSGSGLGLCIVYNLVNFSLNGSISVKNSSEGVVFTIDLP